MTRHPDDCECEDCWHLAFPAPPKAVTINFDGCKTLEQAQRLAAYIRGTSTRPRQSTT